ncbi:MAG: ABC transporter permease [Bdellovibrionota bacterium]
MIKLILSRVALLAITLVGASLISFFLIRLVPGDPVTNLLGERGGTEERILEMRQRFGLDKPLYIQYFKFLESAVHGDLGESIVSKRPVSEEFLSRFPATLELGLAALFWATLLGIPLGIMAAVRRNSVWDYGVMGLSLVGYSMPIFWWGLLLILLFSVNLGWLPVSGRIDIMYDIPVKSGFLLLDTWHSEEGRVAFKSAFRHLVLPAIVLGTIPLAVLARMTRASLLEVLNEDYVRAARAKGLNENMVIYKHALRNALVPIITILGILVASIMTGAVLTETIFSWPGVGRWLVKSIEARDYPVIQGGILYTSFGVVVINLMVDIIYTFVNPRLRRRA